MKIRNAVPADCVALYKLIVHDERRTGAEVAHDEAARIAHVLHVITTGFVLVAESGRSGKILASIGFASGNPGYLTRNTLTGAWYFAATVLQGTNVVQALVKKAVAFAKLHNVAINAILPLHTTELRALLLDYGFEPTGQAYGLKTQEPEEDDEDPATHRAGRIAQPATSGANEAPGKRPEQPVVPRKASRPRDEGSVERAVPDFSDDDSDPVESQNS